MPTEASTGNGDQRVTNAILLRELQSIQSDLKEIKSDYRKDHDTLTMLCSTADKNSKEIEGLRKTNTIISVLTAALTTVLTNIGFSK